MEFSSSPAWASVFSLLININSHNTHRVQHKNTSLPLSCQMTQKGHSEIQKLLMNVLSTSPSIALLVSQDIIFNSTLLQLHFRESQAETEVQRSLQDGKQVLRKKHGVKNREDMDKGSIREEFRTLLRKWNSYKSQAGQEATLRNGKS